MIFRLVCMFNEIEKCIVVKNVDISVQKRMRWCHSLHVG